MDETTIGLTILGMGAVTYLPRLVPLLVLRHRAARRDAMPAPLEAWLRQIPVAVLAAMAVQALFASTDGAAVRLDLLYLFAALPTAWVTWKTRSLFGAVLVGMGIVALGRWILG